MRKLLLACLFAGAAFAAAPARPEMQKVLDKLATAAWYLHANRDGKLYFRNIQNLNAKLESLAGGYARESALKELSAE